MISSRRGPRGDEVMKARLAGADRRVSSRCRHERSRESMSAHVHGVCAVPGSFRAISATLGMPRARSPP